MGGTFSFDDSEFGSATEVDEVAIDDSVASVLESTPVTTEEVADSALEDVDLRLETADHYRAILRHSFFDVSGSAAKIVDNEIRAFIRERLEVLLGIRNPKEPPAPVEAPSQFGTEEVQALKLLAAKVLKKPSIVNGPSVQKMEQPARPVVEPRRSPVVKKIAAPPPSPTTKPAAKPTKKQTNNTDPPKEGASSTPSSKPPARKPSAGSKSQKVVGENLKEQILVEGEVIVENGRKYRVVMNSEGSLFKKDVTGQVVPPGVSRVMSPQEISAISMQHAQTQLGKIDKETGLAIVATLQGQGE